MTVRCIDIVCDSQDKTPPKMSNKLVVQRLHSLERDCQPTADARGLSATIWVAYSVFSSAVNISQTSSQSSHRLPRLPIVRRSDWPLVERCNNTVRTSLVEAFKTLSVAVQVSAIDPMRFFVQLTGVPAGTSDQVPGVSLRHCGRHGVDEKGNVGTFDDAVACVARLGMRFDDEEVHR